MPSAYVFPNQAQPLLTAFPEKITTVCPAPSGLNQHFTAIKTGNVNGSALTSSRGENWVVFTAKKQRFIAGELVEVHIQSPDLSNVAGFQFTLEADTAFLTLQSVAAGTIPTRFGISLEQNRVAASWYSIEPVEGEQTVFVLKFMALKSGTVSQSLQMNSLIAQPEAYDHNLNSAYAVLKFDSFFFPAGSRGNHTHLARFERQGNSNTQRLFWERQSSGGHGCGVIGPDVYDTSICQWHGCAAGGS